MQIWVHGDHNLPIGLICYRLSQHVKISTKLCISHLLCKRVDGNLSSFSFHVLYRIPPSTYHSSGHISYIKLKTEIKLQNEIKAQSSNVSGIANLKSLLTVLSHGSSNVKRRILHFYKKCKQEHVLVKNALV